MKILILSFFDPLMGPIVFLHSPEKIDQEILVQIPELMSLYEGEGFFVHILDNFKSANLNLEISNPFARGKKDMLLLSIIITEGDLNIGLSKDILKKFADEINSIEDAYKALYVNSKKVQGDPKKLEEVNDLFNNFYESFPEESIVETRKDTKIFVFGLSQVGKTTIIKSLQGSKSKKTIPTTSVAITRINLSNNLSIITYDAPGQSKFRTLWTSHLKQQDALVFVLDASKKQEFNMAKEVLHEIATLPMLKDIPLLILYNKVDLGTPKEKEINSELDIDGLGKRPIKTCLTSGTKNKGIKDAFNWLAEELSISTSAAPPKSIVPSEGGLGLIFSRWDEDVGIEITAMHPENSIEDAEIVAVKCFSISQTVFGDKFEKVTFILPFTHRKAKAAIYFDYVLDKVVRGGRLPLSLVVFYKEDVPKALIDLFNLYIFQKFDEIKDHYDNTPLVLDDLKEIYNTIKEGKAEEPKNKRNIQETKKGISFEEFVNQNKSIKHYDTQIITEPSEKVVLDTLKCSICNEEIKLHVNTYQSEFILNLVCDDCFLKYSKEDIELMMNMFIGYEGGYLGRDKGSQQPESRYLQKLLSFIKSKKASTNAEALNIYILKKSLMYGIPPEMFDKKLKIK